MAVKLELESVSRSTENFKGESLVGADTAEAEESPLLKSVTRKRLVKTEKTLYVL